METNQPRDWYRHATKLKFTTHLTARALSFLSSTVHPAIGVATRLSLVPYRAFNVTLGVTFCHVLTLVVVLFTLAKPDFKLGSAV